MTNDKFLTWPISEELIGRKVRFDGYVTGKHNHWFFETGDEYLIGMGSPGEIGPADDEKEWRDE